MNPPDEPTVVHYMPYNPDNFTRVFHITVGPNRATGYEGELVTITETPDGKREEVRRPLKGLIA